MISSPLYSISDIVEISKTLKTSGFKGIISVVSVKENKAIKTSLFENLSRHFQICDSIENLEKVVQKEPFITDIHMGVSKGIWPAAICKRIKKIRSDDVIVFPGIILSDVLTEKIPIDKHLPSHSQPTIVLALADLCFAQSQQPDMYTIIKAGVGFGIGDRYTHFLKSE